MGKTFFVGFVFCFLEAPQRAVHKKQMPFLAGRGAWPSALSRARGLRLSERSGRPMGQGLGLPPVELPVCEEADRMHEAASPKMRRAVSESSGFHF
jgi:hypothetical protein